MFGREGKDYCIPYLGKFLDEEVRLVLINRKTYIVIKDMFRVLGRLTNKGDIKDRDINNLKQLLKDLDKYNESIYKEKIKIYNKIDPPLSVVNQSVENTNVQDKRKNNGKTQRVNLLNIEIIPIVLTQYKPDGNTKKNYEEKLETWRKFMQWVNKLLQDYHLEDFLIEDRNQQLRLQDRCEQLGLDTSIVNKHVNINMAKIVGVYDQGVKELTKDELRYYNDNKTIDLLLVRQEMMKDYLDLYGLFKSKELARKGSLNKCIDRYKVKIIKEYK